jgi:hypothetical protein
VSRRQGSFDNRRTAPLATSTPISDHSRSTRSPVAMVLPSGDHSGAPQNDGERCSGGDFVSSTRSPVPSALAITIALSPCFGVWMRCTASCLPSGENVTALSTLVMILRGVPPRIGSW